MKIDSNTHAIKLLSYFLPGTIWRICTSVFHEVAFFRKHYQSRQVGFPTVHQIYRDYFKQKLLKEWKIFMSIKSSFTIFIYPILTKFSKIFVQSKYLQKRTLVPHLNCELTQLLFKKRWPKMNLREPILMDSLVSVFLSIVFYRS